MAPTGNLSINTPYDLPNALTCFNAIFNMFWLTQDFATSAGSLSFPSQLLWIISIIFTQSYTVYMTMVIVPYTRHSWRVKASVVFILTAWWVQSWAWYSISGLVLADMVINMDFQAKAMQGIPLLKSRGVYLPSWVVYLVLMAAGICMQYLWTDWRPQDVNSEILIHTGLYYSGGLNTTWESSQPQARDDVYLVVVGLLLAVETYDWMQWVFRNRFFVYMGNRSLPWLFAQGIVVYTAGMRLFAHLNVTHHVGSYVSVLACFIVCVLTTAALAEIFYRLVDRPSRAFSHLAYDWIVD